MQNAGAKFYTFIYLQGSQTPIAQVEDMYMFYTFIYLQGSQTSIYYFEIITVPIHIDICVSSL